MEISQQDVNQSAQWNLVPLEYKSMFKVDIHNAHVQGDETYHYHGNPNAMFDDSPSGNGSPLMDLQPTVFQIWILNFGETTGSLQKFFRFSPKKEQKAPKKPNPGGPFPGF
jgi:hypothetical protein